MSELNLKELCEEFGKLCEEFGKLCDDFNDEWHAESKLPALGFMKQVLYEISPKAHAIKKNNEDDLKWILRFGEDGKNIVHIATFFKSPPSFTQPRIFNGNELILTVEQAMLLACVGMEKVIPILPLPVLSPLPPLVAKVFNESDIRNIAEELNISPEKVAQVVVSSSPRSGHLLTHSSCAVAVVYAFEAIGNPVQRETVKAKIIQKYSGKGKPYDQHEFSVYYKHSYGIQVNKLVDAILDAIDKNR